MFIMFKLPVPEVPPPSSLPQKQILKLSRGFPMEKKQNGVSVDIKKTNKSDITVFFHILY